MIVKSFLNTLWYSITHHFSLAATQVGGQRKGGRFAACLCCAWPLLKAVQCVAHCGSGTYYSEVLKIFKKGTPDSKSLG